MVRAWLQRLWSDQGGSLRRSPHARRRAAPPAPARPGPAQRPTHRARMSRRGERGIALIMVLSMMVFLTAFIVEFAYQSRVDYLQAAHYRDKVKAHYLAQSGVRIYTLFMAFAQTAANNPMIQQYGGMLGIDIGDKLWQQLPFIDTAFLRMGMGGGLEAYEDTEEGFNLGALEGGRQEFDIPEQMQERIDREIERDDTALTRSFLGFEGDFRADINDEDGKLNINALADSTRPDLRTDPFALAMYGLMADDRYDEMFEERNEFDRWELIANIKDFIDTDEQGSGIIGGYEDSLYDDSDLWGRDFEPKNVKFDSLDEVQLVAGVNDEIYMTFGPAWTIYGNNKINITTCSPAVLFALVRAFADYTVSDQMIHEAVGDMTMLKLFGGLTTESMLSTLAAKGITLTDANALKGLIKTNSRTFTIVSTGYVGDVEASIEVVMNFNGGRYKILSWQER